MLVQAWLMDDSNEDPRLPHHPNPKELLTMDYLAGFSLSLASTYSLLSFFLQNEFLPLKYIVISRNCACREYDVVVHTLLYFELR